MTLVETSLKSLKIWSTDIKKVTIRPNGSEVQIRPELEPKELCFTANTANSTVQLTKQWSPTSVTLEKSTDWKTWESYTIWSTITLTNEWDKIYFRNTSESTTGFGNSTSDYYQFLMTWSIAASGDVTSLINKNWTDAMISDCCFFSLFKWCTSLTSSPKLPATTLTVRCYRMMFQWCTNLETLPALPATTLVDYCYSWMFEWCSKIKISTTQTWEYQNEYRMPITWTWTATSSSLSVMFSSTWWTFTSAPSVNTTYYTSNTVVS